MTKTRLMLVSGIVILGVAAYFFLTKRNAQKLSYREKKVERTTISVTVLATGTVQPQNRLEIKPPIAGRIENVLVTEGQEIRKGQILAWMSSSERAALLDAARAKGEAELERWEALYKPAPIIAPIHGTLIRRYVEPGQTFSSSDTVLVLSDRLIVKAQVDETDIAQIKLKQEASIILDAYPNQKLDATVDQIGFEAKTVNNVTTYIVDVLPKTTPTFMRSGMTANVSFVTTTKENVLSVPAEMLKLKENTYFVFTRQSAKKPPMEQPVQIGISDGRKTEIVSGLREGDSVWLAELPNATSTPAASPFTPMGARRRSRNHP